MADEARGVDTEFRFKEYDALRKELDGLLSGFLTNEIYATLATVAVWTWLASRQADANWAVYRLAWWIPFGLVMVCLLRAFAFLEGVERLSQRIAQIENELGIRGWETIQIEERAKGPVSQVKRGVYRYTHLSKLVFWSGLIILTVVVPVLVWYCPRPASR
jgi:hypothetical protein